MEVGIPDRFGVELVTQDPPILRPQTHRFLGGPTADSKIPLPLESEGVVSYHIHALRGTLERTRPVMNDACRGSMHRSTTSLKTEPRRHTERLMTQTDAEDAGFEGPFDSSVGQGHRQWSIGWLAWPRTEDDVRWIRGEHILDSVRQRPSTRGDPDIPARACEEIRDVPGEGIEIVHQNDPILHRHSVDSSDLLTSGWSTCQQAVNCERPTLHLRGCIPPTSRTPQGCGLPFGLECFTLRIRIDDDPPPASTRPNQCPSSSRASSVRIRMLQC